MISNLVFDSWSSRVIHKAMSGLHAVTESSVWPDHVVWSRGMITWYDHDARDSRVPGVCLSVQSVQLVSKGAASTTELPSRSWFIPSVIFENGEDILKLFGDFWNVVS